LQLIRHQQGRTLQQRVCVDVLDDGRLRLRGVDVMLHVHRPQLVLGREAVKLAVGDGAHQRRLQQRGRSA